MPCFYTYFWLYFNQLLHGASVWTHLTQKFAGWVDSDCGTALSKQDCFPWSPLLPKSERRIPNLATGWIQTFEDASFSPWQVRLCAWPTSPPSLARFKFGTYSDYFNLILLARAMFDTFFWPGRRSKKATWGHLGPLGRERATSINIRLVVTVRSTPKVDFGQIGRLSSWKGGFTWPGGGVRANRDCAPKSSIAASFVSNSSRGSWWNTDTTRSIDSALHDIFDLFSLSRDLI